MPEGVPVQKVIDMRIRNADNNAIIEALRSEGYSFPQIRDAVQQADLKKTVGTPQMVSAPVQQMPQQNMQAPSQQVPVQQMQPRPVSNQTPSSNPSPMQQPISQIQQKRGFDLDEIQRVLEEIIEEKWQESEDKLVKFNEWRAVINTKIKEFDTRIAELNTRIDGLNVVMGKKAEAFDETMRSVDTEIKALEKALGKIVPILSDNIGELRELVTEFKKEPSTTSSENEFKPSIRNEF